MKGRNDMKALTKMLAASCAIALAGTLAACSGGSSGTGEGNAGSAPAEQRSTEDVAALSATIDDTYIIRENLNRELFVVEATVTNDSVAPVTISTGGIVSNGYLEVSSDATMYCTRGDVALFDDEVEPSNPDYKGINPDVIEPGQTVPMQFCYLLYNEPDVGNIDFGSPSDPITFVINTPIVPAGYSPDDEVDSTDFEYETLIEQSYDYDELDVHGVSTPYRLLNGSMDDAVDENGDMLLAFSFALFNEGDEAVTFDDTFIIKASIEGQELEVVQDCDWGPFEGELHDYYYRRGGGDTRLSPGEAVTRTVEPGAGVHIHPGVCKLTDFEIDPGEVTFVDFAIYLADDPSYPVYTYSRRL